MKYFLAILISILITGCIYDQDVLKLRVINRSDGPVYYRLKVDTQLVLRDVEYIPKVGYMQILPKDTGWPRFARNNESWTQKIQELSADSTFHLYIFKVRDVERHGWPIVLSERKYRRLDLTPKQLDSITWTVYGDPPQ